MENSLRLPPPARTRKIPLSIRGSPKSWAHSISDCGFSLLECKKSYLAATKIESYDFSSKPHQYVRLKFTKNSIEVSLTLKKGQNPALREVEAAQLALLSLSSIGGASLSPMFCAYLSQTLSRARELLTPSLALLEHNNFLMKKRISELEARLSSLYAQKEEGTRIALENAKRLKALQGRLAELERIPDSMLDGLALSWLLEHDGEICPQEFCSMHAVAPARLEASLDRLCKASKIRRI